LGDLRRVGEHLRSLEFRLGEVAARRTHDAGCWVALEQLAAAARASDRRGWRRRRRLRRLLFWAQQVGRRGWPLGLQRRQWST
jgi:hypothetical protein